MKGTTVILYKFAAKQRKKEYKLGVKVSVKLTTIRDGVVQSTETRQ